MVDFALPAPTVEVDPDKVIELRAHGRLLEIADYENERRARYGLPPIDETADEVRTILNRTRPEKRPGEEP